MSYTWISASAELGRILDDTGLTPTITNELRMDGYNSAMVAFAYHTAIATSVDWTADGALSSFDRPDNALDGLAYVYIWDETTLVWLRPIRINVGSLRPDPTPISTDTDKHYYEWPTGKVQLGFIPGADQLFNIFYYAHYNAVVDDDSEIDLPIWGRTAALYYAAAYCLNPKSASSARIRQFNQKQDSGNPDHNPLLKVRRDFMEQYETIMAQHTMQEKAPPYRGVL